MGVHESFEKGWEYNDDELSSTKRIPQVNYLEDVAYSVHEYVWVYNTNVGQTKNYFTTAHRSILHVTKDKNNRFYKKNVLEEYKNPESVRQKLFRRRVIKALAKNEFKKIKNSKQTLSEFEKEHGARLWNEINKGHIEDIDLSKEKKQIVLDSWEKTDEEFRGLGRMPYSWFENNLVKNISKEKTIHEAQIPKAISKKLIYACTEPGDTVLVLFGGSGSE